MGYQTIRCLPCLARCLPYDHMQTNTKADLAAERRRFGSYLFNLLLHLFRRFTPGQIEINLPGSQILCDVRRAAEIEWRMRLLDRREEQFCPANMNMFAVEIHGFTLQ